MDMNKPSKDTHSIAELNDLLRETFWGGKIFVSDGVEQLPMSLIMRIFGAVRDFEYFTEDNDPYGEHDFGKLNVGKQEILWKIDYYDLRMEFASPDPANPEVTERVLTIMLASEY